MEIEINEDGCCTVKVAVPQLMRPPGKDPKNRRENSETGEQSLDNSLKTGSSEDQKDNEYEMEQELTNGTNQTSISCRLDYPVYQSRIGGGKIEMGSVEPLPILDFPEEPAVRHGHQSPKGSTPSRSVEMETSFSCSGLPTDKTSMTVKTTTNPSTLSPTAMTPSPTLQDGGASTGRISRRSSSRVSFEDDLYKSPGADNSTKSHEIVSPDMSPGKEMGRNPGSKTTDFSTKEQSPVKYPKKKVTLKMTKKVEEFNKTMVDDDFPLEFSGMATKNSPNERETSFCTSGDRLTTPTIEVPPADYSRRRSKIESFGAHSKQFQSIGQCEFCALHLEKVLRGDFPPRPQNYANPRTIRTRSSEIDTTDQQMRRERFYQQPQRSVGDVIYQEIYSDPRTEERPQNSVHTIMVGGSSRTSRSFRSRQYHQAYSYENVPPIQSLDLPEVPPSNFNPNRRRTIEELKNFSITIPVQIKKQPSQDSGGRQSLGRGGPGPAHPMSQKQQSSYNARKKSKGRIERSSSIYGREGRSGRGRKATLTTSDLPAGTYTPVEDPGTMDILLMESKPANYLWLALCTTIFFNPIFGIVALVLSMQSDSAFAKKRYEQARRLGRAVKYVSLLGMGTTVGVIIILTVELGSPQIT